MLIFHAHPSTLGTVGRPLSPWPFFEQLQSNSYFRFGENTLYKAIEGKYFAQLHPAGETLAGESYKRFSKVDGVLICTRLQAPDVFGICATSRD